MSDNEGDRAAFLLTKKRRIKTAVIKYIFSPIYSPCKQNLLGVYV